MKFAINYSKQAAQLVEQGVIQSIASNVRIGST
jgi:hypothetical protein